MGNCQAAEAASVVIQHPGVKGKVERIYRAVAASQVMCSNPGHYVALVFKSPAQPNGPPVKQLKLLRPDETLHIGHVYRLITFEDVIKEFTAKKSVKLGKLIGAHDKRKKLDAGSGSSKQDNTDSAEMEELDHLLSNTVSNSSSGRGVGRHHGGGGQWKPALQSITEIGT